MPLITGAIYERIVFSIPGVFFTGDPQSVGGADAVQLVCVHLEVRRHEPAVDHGGHHGNRPLGALGRLAGCVRRALPVTVPTAGEPLHPTQKGR